MASDVLSDLPESADRYEFNVQDGDVIIMATDGIFDNVPDSILVAEIRLFELNDFFRFYRLILLDLIFFLSTF